RANIRELANSGIGILITDHNVREVFRTADRVYLITNGKVVTSGTPHELVNDQIAIDAYLGRSFEEDGFTRQFQSRTTVSPSMPGERTLPSESRTVATAIPTVAPVASSTATATVTVPPPPAFPAAPPTTNTTPPPAFPAAPPSPFSITPPPVGVPTSGSMAAILESEKLRRAVEGLADQRETVVKAAMLEL